MRLTARTEYALLALIYLAGRYGREPVTVPEISESEGIPPRFLQQILQTLKAARIVSSSQGRGGGFQLARDPRSLTLAEVIRLFDGALAPTESVSVHFYHSTPIERHPGLLGVFREIRDYISSKMESVTLADLLSAPEPDR